MSLLKLPLILSSTLGMHMAGTSPNAPAPTTERVRTARWREVFLTSARIAIVVKTLFVLGGFAEGAVILASHYPSSPLSRLILTTLGSGSTAHFRTTPLFVLGSLFTFLGGVIRFLCYRTLGRFFTFELSIRRNHRLITTGPYSLVRHPGYTGTIFTLVGALCSHATSGAFVRECGLLDNRLGQTVAFVWVAAVLSIMGSLFLRMPKEDEVLRKEFGKEWDQWAQDVKYKLIPGVY